jgi:hypothetical protein
MHDNPYEPPTASSELPQFYTDDITLMPPAVIWRTVRRQSLVGCVLLFPYFAARKLLRLRHRANHGTARVTALPLLPEEQIPKDVGLAFKPFMEVCKACQMDPVQYIRSPCIGNKTSFSSIWLDPTGRTYANMTWIDIQLGGLRRTKTVFACHSWLQSGVELHTAPMAPEDWIPEIVPPNQDILALAADTSPSQVIDRHRERIAARSDVCVFDEESLRQAILRSSQEIFDYMVARGIYSPLTKAETERLAVAQQRALDRPMQSKGCP